MGFLGDLLKKGKGSAADPLREKADANPKDPRAQMDVATSLKGKGDVAGAIDYARRSAQAHRDAGFSQRALATLKTALPWAPESAVLLEDLGTLYVELKLKEDARQVLNQLRRVYAAAGQSADVDRVDARLKELGPSR